MDEFIYAETIGKLRQKIQKQAKRLRLLQQYKETCDATIDEMQNALDEKTNIEQENSQLKKLLQIEIEQKQQLKQLAEELVQQKAIVEDTLRNQVAASQSQRSLIQVLQNDRSLQMTRKREFLTLNDTQSAFTDRGKLGQDCQKEQLSMYLKDALSIISLAEEQMKNKEKQIEQLTEKLNLQERKEQELIEEIEKLRDNLLGGDVNRVHNIVKTLRNSQQAQQNILAGKEVSLSNLKHLVGQLRFENTQKSQQIQALEQELERKNQQIRNLQNKIEQLERKAVLLGVKETGSEQQKIEQIKGQKLLKAQVKPIVLNFQTQEKLKTQQEIVRNFLENYEFPEGYLQILKDNQDTIPAFFDTSITYTQELSKKFEQLLISHKQLSSQELDIQVQELHFELKILKQTLSKGREKCAISDRENSALVQENKNLHLVYEQLSNKNKYLKHKNSYLLKDKSLLENIIGYFLAGLSKQSKVHKLLKMREQLQQQQEKRLELDYKISQSQTESYTRSVSDLRQLRSNLPKIESSIFSLRQKISMAQDFLTNESFHSNMSSYEQFD